MPLKRKEIFNMNHVSFFGKVSSYISTINIINGLVPGSWLDILSGYNADLQTSQINNQKIKSFVSLDHKLNKRLKKQGFTLKEQFINETISLKDVYDNITIVNGLEHLWNPLAILTECFRAMRPNGVLQVIVPTWFGKPILEFIAFTLNGKQEKIEMDDHKTYFDEKSIWPMFVKAGFRPQNIKMKRIKLFCSLYIKATKQA